MARKTTTSTKPVAPANAEAPAKPKKLVAKRAIKPATKTKAAPAKGRRPAVAASPRKPRHTTEDVALRAYFISEKRRSHGLPGDEHQDWLEAERQLAAESKSAKKTSRV